MIIAERDIVVNSEHELFYHHLHKTDVRVPDELPYDDVIRLGVNNVFFAYDTTAETKSDMLNTTS